MASQPQKHEPPLDQSITPDGTREDVSGTTGPTMKKQKTSGGMPKMRKINPADVKVGDVLWRSPEDEDIWDYGMVKVVQLPKEDGGDFTCKRTLQHTFEVPSSELFTPPSDRWDLYILATEFGRLQEAEYGHRETTEIYEDGEEPHPVCNLAIQRYRDAQEGFFNTLGGLTSSD